MESDRREFAPLLFKIIGYDNENVVKNQYPTIKLEGYMGGEEWNENAVGNGYVHDIRAIEGSVSMLSDGNIRWSMASSRHRVGLSFTERIIPAILPR